MPYGRSSVHVSELRLKPLDALIQEVFYANNEFLQKIFEESQEVEERMARLRSKKDAIADEIDDRRAATRFEPTVDESPAAPTPLS